MSPPDFRGGSQTGWRQKRFKKKILPRKNKKNQPESSIKKPKVGPRSKRKTRNKKVRTGKEKSKKEHPRKKLEHTPYRIVGKTWKKRELGGKSKKRIGLWALDPSRPKGREGPEGS